MFKSPSFILLAFIVAFFSGCAADDLQEKKVLSDEEKNQVFDLTSFEKCSEKNSQIVAKECAFELFDLAQKSLEEAYKVEYEQAKNYFQEPKDNVDRLENLEKSQKGWKIYRDEYCLYKSYAYKGGSIEAFENARCLYELTQQRITQLKTSITPDLSFL